MNSYQMNYLKREIQQRQPVKVKSYRFAKSRKSRECSYCGCEIPPNELYYSYKPMFSKRRARCWAHPPKIYNDYERFDI